jgi:dipeptidyl aminopeptidase/acylaminoacyl peptidase
MVSHTPRYARAASALVYVVSVVAVSLVAGSAFADPIRPITTRDLATLRDVNSLSLSPDGAWASFQVMQADPDRNTYDLSWYVVPTSGAAEARELADAGPLGRFLLGVSDRVFGGYDAPPPAIWSLDGTWISYLRWDDQRAQIWRVRRSGGAPQRLTRNDGNVRRFVYTSDGARILYETEPSLAQINAALETEGRTGFLFDGRFSPEFSNQPVIAGAPGVATSPPAANHSIWAYDFAQRRERPATLVEQAEFERLTDGPSVESAHRVVVAPVASPQGLLAWTEARDPRLQGFRPPQTIVAQPRTGSDPIACNAASCQDQVIRHLWWRNDNELILLRAEGPNRRDSGIFAWRLSDNSVRPILQTQSQLLRHHSSNGPAHSSCAIGSDKLICFYEDWTTPRRLVAINLDDGAVETLYNANPSFAHFDLGQPPQRLLFHADSGETYSGVLALPPGRRPDQRVPLVIVTYQCSGFLRGGMGDEYPVYPLTAVGFAVLCLESPEDQEQMAHLDAAAYDNWSQGPNGAIRQRLTEELQAAIRYLDDRGIIDPTRVGMTGLSHGAQLVRWALTAMPSLAAASMSSGIALDGTSMIYYLLPQRHRSVLQSRYGIGNPRDDPESWQALAFTPQIDRVRTPLLINVADHELMQALEPVITLQETGHAAEMYVYPDEYHWKWQPAHRLAIYNRNIDWMNFWLRGVEDPDPAKSAQYARWQGLRDGYAASETVLSPRAR